MHEWATIPGLGNPSGPDPSQVKSGDENKAQPATSEPSTEMEVEATTTSDSVPPPESGEVGKKEPENVDIVINDAPSPPSLTSALEAMLGGLDPTSQDSSTTHAQPNGTEQNEQAHDQDGEGGAEWEEDSSPYESSSDSSDTGGSDDESEGEANYELLGPEETARLLMEMEGGSDDEGEGKAKGSGSGAQVRTKHELPEEVVPKPDVVITPEMDIIELGLVEHIVENTVLVKANTTGEYQVIDTGSVLCTEDRTVVAAVADLIGNVQQPRYTARFTNEEEIKSFGLELGAKVFYPPSHASYVFTQALRQQKGTDASNWHDEEAGDDEMEFSDDEKEAEYKRQQKAKKRGGRGGRGGAGGRGGRSEPSPFPAEGVLKYDDEDDDGPYRKLARPPSFAQGQPTPSGSGYANTYANNNDTFRGGRGRGQRGRGYGRGGRGNRGDRGGHSLPPRPPRGQDFQSQAQQFNHPFIPPVPPVYPPYPAPMAQDHNRTQTNQQPLGFFPLPWQQNMQLGFLPPMPPQPQISGQLPGTNSYYNPQNPAPQHGQTQGQPSQQNGPWPGHGRDG
ncbi:NAF1-domain-containing protein [Hypoxylon crocopeplum]|nr:NAF1-domain-containing protein [Hypoxylon crocopeplum]